MYKENNLRPSVIEKHGLEKYHQFCEKFDYDKRTLLSITSNIFREFSLIHVNNVLNYFKNIGIKYVICR